MYRLSFATLLLRNGLVPSVHVLDVVLKDTAKDVCELWWDVSIKQAWIWKGYCVYFQWKKFKSWGKFSSKRKIALGHSEDQSGFLQMALKWLHLFTERNNWIINNCCESNSVLEKKYIIEVVLKPWRYKKIKRCMVCREKGHIFLFTQIGWPKKMSF